jgi:hypothetical protein
MTDAVRTADVHLFAPKPAIRYAGPGFGRRGGGAKYAFQVVVNMGLEGRLECRQQQSQPGVDHHVVLAQGKRPANACTLEVQGIALPIRFEVEFLGKLVGKAVGGLARFL